MLSQDEFMKVNFPAETKLMNGEIDKEEYNNYEDKEDDIMSADLYIKNGAYCFKLNNFECWFDSYEGTIEDLKEEIHRQTDYIVDECLRAALGRQG